MNTALPLQNAGVTKSRATQAAVFSDVETDSEAPFTSDSETDDEGMCANSRGAAHISVSI